MLVFERNSMKNYEKKSNAQNYNARALSTPDIPLQYTISVVCELFVLVSLIKRSYIFAHLI